MSLLSDNNTYIVPADCDQDCSDFTNASICVLAGVTSDATQGSCLWHTPKKAVDTSCVEHPYCEALNDAENQANYVMSIPYIISAGMWF